MKDDPAIKRIRDVRHQTSEEHGHDPKRLVAYYMELQRQREEECSAPMHEYERALPIVGERFVKLRFCGNGKDSEATIEIEGKRKIVVPLSNAAMDINFSDATMVRTRGWGDTEVVIEIVPVADQPVTIGEASVRFPGSDEEWNKFLRDYADTGRWKMSWCVSLRLRLVAMGSQ